MQNAIKYPNHNPGKSNCQAFIRPKQSSTLKLKKPTKPLFSVVYHITHKTASTGGNADGAPSGAYFFTFIGTAGETDAHDCPADREIGATGSCTMDDFAKIGKLLKVRIESKQSNQWQIVSMTVKVVGALQGRWTGERLVDSFQKVDLIVIMTVFEIGNFYQFFQIIPIENISSTLHRIPSMSM